METIKVYKVLVYNGYYGQLYLSNDNLITLCYARNIVESVLWTRLGLGVVKIPMDYVRENCNDVSELSGKCQGISSGVVCGNPVTY